MDRNVNVVSSSERDRCRSLNDQEDTGLKTEQDANISHTCNARFLDAKKVVEFGSEYREGLVPVHVYGYTALKDTGYTCPDPKDENNACFIEKMFAMGVIYKSKQTYYLTDEQCATCREPIPTAGNTKMSLIYDS